MKYLRRCKKYVSGVADRLAGQLAKAAEAVTAAWRRHWDRMSDEPGYAQAFVTVVIAVVELATGSVRIRSVVRELVAAYAAVLRALRPRFPGYGWDWPADN